MMRTVAANGIDLEYATTGSGDPVVFIHGALIADSFEPILSHPALTGRYRLTTYHRRGYEGSTHPAAMATVADQAADCRALLDQLEIDRAHVVGHSFGGVIALKLAMDFPAVVETLTLLEPALVLGANGPGYLKAIAQARQRYRNGDVEGTVDEFLRVRFGNGYRSSLERIVPGAFAQAVANAGVAFEVDMPSAADFPFSEAEARTISQPALVVLGAESDALWRRFGETHRFLMTWLQRGQSYVLPHATHALQMQNPQDFAIALDEFLATHVIEHR
jgi:pimeloyl-ACP methyl ester carboxylesterase